METKTTREALVKSIGRLLDLTGGQHSLPTQDPAQAMAEDWRQVGDDLRGAMDEVRRELTDEQRTQLELVEA